MLSFPRSAARRMRTLARKCLPGRAREPMPPVAVVPSRRSAAFLMAFDDVIVRLQLPSCEPPEPYLLLSMESLEAVESACDDLVQVESDGSTLNFHWTDRGLPRSQQFLAPTATEPPARPSAPKSMAPVPLRFLTALHEAGRCAARESQRYALNRVQVRGKPGEVIGTDARFVVRFEGFSLPFTEEVLIPAVPLFGLEEWSRASEVRVGRTSRTLVIATDEITVWQRIDREGRFPDVAGILPRSKSPTRVALADSDALFLLDAIPELPCANELERPVTIELESNASAVVRAAGPETDSTVEVRLPCSLVSGASAKVALDRRYLARLLTLGARSLQVHRDGQPLVALGENMTILAMPLDSTALVPSTASARVLSPDSATEPVPNLRSPMKISESSNNGHAENDALDPLTEVEALRQALGEVLQRLTRLMTALRSRRKEQKALTQVWSSLKNLQLGG